jgi:SAM-dependent methyltransferase
VGRPPLGRRPAVVQLGDATTKLYEEHADLYDLAFDWDLTAEAAWLREWLGEGCRAVLEPGCGSGRMLVALGRLGLEVVGIDSSPAMIAVARQRLASAGVSGFVVEGDMTAFDLGRRFDGAVCPIATITHLAPEALTQHLVCMGAHLRAGSTYLVQLALYDHASIAAGVPSSHWETKDETPLRIDWTTEKVDLAAGRSLQRSRIEILAGPRRGEVVVEDHEMTAWTPETWAAAIATSPFTIEHVFDGAEEPPLPVSEGATGGLLWYDLRRKRDY